MAEVTRADREMAVKAAWHAGVYGLPGALAEWAATGDGDAWMQASVYAGLAALFAEHREKHCAQVRAEMKCTPAMLAELERFETALAIERANHGKECSSCGYALCMCDQQ